jgi:hypothetical protein
MSVAMPEPESSSLDAARTFAARGWRPFPVEYTGKRPAVGIKWGTATASAPTDATLRLWFGRDPVNVGIAARGSGLVFLDDDTGTGDAMERLCDAYGQEVPKTYRVRTAKGWHWYFRATPGVEIGNAGQGSYLKDEFGFDVRGNRGGQQDAGGYVVAASSVHASGLIYTAESPDAEAAPLPDWLLEVLEANDAAISAATLTASGEPNPDRRYTVEQAEGWVQKHALDKLRKATDGGRNNALNTAAVVVGHFVPEFWSEKSATEALAEEADRLGLDPREIGPTIRSGLRKGMSQPYMKVDSAVPFSSASENSREDESDAFETEVERKLRDLRVTEEARRRLSRERRATRPSIAGGVMDDLDSIPEPAMLLGSLIPEQAVGFLAGRSGAYKSFLAAAWACCIATGRPWLGRPMFAVSAPRKVLYVAAEGAAGAAGRVRAWEADTGTSRRGKLLLYPRPIHLNDPAQVEELVAYVVEHGIGFLVIDTYHRSAPGTEENSATEFGLIFETAAGLRDEHDCSSLFIDHTGGQKNGNPRGSSAKRDDADYVLSATYPGEEAIPSAQRELFVTKLKDTDTTGRWGIRLFPVEGQTFPVVKIGMVEGADALAMLGDWWLVENCPEIPATVGEAIDKAASDRKGAGREGARWTWRLLTAIGDQETGLSGAEIKRMLQASPPGEKFSEEQVRRGIAVLKKAGCAYQDGARILLEDQPC